MEPVDVPRWRARQVDVTPAIKALVDMESLFATYFDPAPVGDRLPACQVWWQAVKGRDGKMIWCQNFGTEDEALEAAGLSE